MACMIDRLNMQGGERETTEGKRNIVILNYGQQKERDSVGLMTVNGRIFVIWVWLYQGLKVFLMISL